MNTRSIVLTLGLVFALVASSARADAPAFMAKKDAKDLRLLCFNINWDSIFAPDDPQNHRYRRHDTHDAFVRILKAIKPDLICLQELNPDRKPEQLVKMLDEILPLGQGQALERLPRARQT